MGKELVSGHLLEENKTVGGAQHRTGILEKERLTEEQLHGFELLNPDALRQRAELAVQLVAREGGVNLTEVAIRKGLVEGVDTIIP